ncbi:hypothetical protein IU444_28770 [Nocardia farcinica]|uniref:hypothetical protein n=1 Tax=Nocardia farcinica TaxID=37329 RepID=UPI0018936EF2|nr:hypothetical protein [Nocardia farcinica]MBF6388124.1 hypothetical protein [Nocardia farcinica]UEX26378.1 hypothetical protein LMJ57_30990 [Nocardia farcinica]
MVDVLGLVRETAERLEGQPPDLSPATALARAHTGFGALTLAAAVLSGQTNSRSDELAAVNLAVVEAHTHIAEVIGEDPLDEASDDRVVELLADPETLPRIRVSARRLREAALRVVNATRSILAGAAAAAGLTPDLREAIHQAGAILDDIHLLLDGPAHLRTALAHDYYQRMVLDE